MSHRISFVLDAFSDRVPRDLSHDHLKTMLSALTKINVDTLRARKDIPPLYDSRVSYQEEPPGAEDWCDAPTALKLGAVDCEDLACWRAAELIVAGIEARPAFTYARKPDGSYLYHIVVVRPDGTVEDPSRELGMR